MTALTTYFSAGVYVSYVRDKSPADEAGVVAGDEILAVNDLKLRKATTPEVTRYKNLPLYKLSNVVIIPIVRLYAL